MSQQENIASQQAFGSAVNSGRLDELDSLVAADSVDHDPAPGQGSGPQGYRDMFGELRAAFPDLHIEVDRLVANETDVSFAYTLSGTHDGTFEGHPPTGKSFSVHGLQISRFENAKLVERWGSSDQLSLMQQLGLA